MPRIAINKTTRRFIYIGVLAYLLFLLHGVPAQIMYRYILPRVDHARLVQLRDVHGSIWQGQAGNAKVSGLDLGKLQWDMHGWGLLLGKLKLGLKFGEASLRGSAHVDLGMSGAINASKVNFQMPADNLMPLLYGYPISLGGILRGNLKQASLKPGQQIQLRGRIVWQEAALRTPQNLALGEYLVTLEPVNAGSKVTIKDQGQSAVQAEIDIDVKGTGIYRIHGWVKARDANRQEITEALRWLGKPDSSGRYWLNLNGILRGWKR